MLGAVQVNRDYGRKIKAFLLLWSALCITLNLLYVDCVYTLGFDPENTAHSTETEVIS